MLDDLTVSPDGRTAVPLAEGTLQRGDLDRLPKLRQIRPTLYPSNLSMASGWSLAVNTGPEGTETFEGRYGAAPVETDPEHVGLGSALPEQLGRRDSSGRLAHFHRTWDAESGETIDTISDDSDTVTFWDFKLAPVKALAFSRSRAL